MTTRNFPGGTARQARNADVTAICQPTVEKMWDLRRLTTLQACTAFYGENFNSSISGSNGNVSYPLDTTRELETYPTSTQLNVPNKIMHARIKQLVFMRFIRFQPISYGSKEPLSTTIFV
jgi:hypothetical protein